MAGIGHLPSIENLQCFVAAAEHLNFRRAAAQMSLTPTAFGQRIKQLEEQLGEELFERTTRRVDLTEPGRRLLPTARDAIALAHRCTDVVHSGTQTPVRLTLGTRFELGMSWVVPATLELKEARPHWHIDLDFGSSDDILEKLRMHRVDGIVTSAPVARRGWGAHVLHPEAYVFVASPKLLATQPFDTLEDAGHHTLIDIDDSLPLTRYLAPSSQLQFRDVWLAGAGASMLELVLLGHGVAVLPRYMVRAHLDEGRLTRLLPDETLLEDTFRLLFRKDSPLSRELESLAEFLRTRPLT